MGLRRVGCFTPAALLLVVGTLLIVWGSLAETARPVRYGALCLAGALAFLGGALYVRWQGWE